MNLRAAQKELRSRSPEVGVTVLLAETVVIFGAGMLLVGLFA